MQKHFEQQTQQLKECKSLVEVLQSKWDHAASDYERVKQLHEECEHSLDATRTLVDRQDSELANLRYQLKVFKDATARLEKEREQLRNNERQTNDEFQIEKDELFEQIKGLEERNSENDEYWRQQVSDIESHILRLKEAQEERVHRLVRQHEDVVAQLHDEMRDMDADFQEHAAAVQEQAKHFETSFLEQQASNFLLKQQLESVQTELKQSTDALKQEVGLLRENNQQLTAGLEQAREQHAQELEMLKQLHVNEVKAKIGISANGPSLKDLAFGRSRIDDEKYRGELAMLLTEIHQLHSQLRQV